MLTSAAEALGLALVEIRMALGVGSTLLLLLGAIVGDVDSDGRAATGGVVGRVVLSGAGGRMTMGGHTSVGRMRAGLDFAGGEGGAGVVVVGAGVSGVTALGDSVVGAVVAGALVGALLAGCVVLRGAGVAVVVSAGDGSTDA
jgi:hypothetical protein